MTPGSSYSQREKSEPWVSGEENKRVPSLTPDIMCAHHLQVNARPTLRDPGCYTAPGFACSRE